MSDLSATQLEQVQRLVTAPLQATVRAEMETGHEKLAGAIDRLGDRLAGHLSDHKKLERRVDDIDRRVTSLERFRVALNAGWAVVTSAVSIGWGVVRFRGHAKR